MWPLQRSKSGDGNRSKLYLDPAELAQKLVKELESDKVSRGSRVSVRNRYTVYLCREDYQRLSPQADRLIEKLELHLTRHVRAKKYEVPGAIKIRMVADPDLDLGHFGIYGERELSSSVVRTDKAASPSYRAADDLAAAPASAAAGSSASVRPAAARATSGSGAPVRSAQPRPRPPRAEVGSKVDASTRVISAGEAQEAGLARQTIVLTVDNEEHVFNQGRVIVGRSRDVDYRIESPDVSRRHAVFYWSDGNIVVKDLGSTNGTMVNGYPVESTVVRPGDVVLVGDRAIRAEAG